MRKARVFFPSRVPDGGRHAQPAKVDGGAHSGSRPELRRQGVLIVLRRAEGGPAFEERPDSSPYQRGGRVPFQHYGKFPRVRRREVVSVGLGGAACRKY